jgi:glycine cleavage system H protein
MTQERIPTGLFYTEEHEWLRQDPNDDTLYIVGVTIYAQDALGELTYLELPEDGEEYESGDNFGIIESVKTFSDLYMPVSGTIEDFNAEALEEPTVINKDPYGEGWLVKIRVTPESFEAAKSKLMDSDQYDKHLDG